MKCISRGIFFLFFTLFAGVSFSSVHIYEIKQLSEMLACIEGRADELVIFDIDHTLLIACDEATQDEVFWEGMKRHTAAGKTWVEAKKLEVEEMAHHHKNAPVCLVDEEMPQIKSALLHKGVHMIALTARTPVSEFLEATFRQLNDLSLDFEQQDERWMCGYLFPAFGSDVMYRNGVLFADGKDKGEVLQAFLQKVGYEPKHLIFVDDSLSNVQSLGRMAEKLGMRYDGFHFIKAQELIKMGYAFLLLRATSLGTNNSAVQRTN